MNKLTPVLNAQQIKENIDALQKQGVSNDEIQKYVDNYKVDGSGGYILKNSAEEIPSPEVKEPKKSIVNEALNPSFKPVAGLVSGALKGVASTLYSVPQNVGRVTEAGTDVVNTTKYKSMEELANATTTLIKKVRKMPAGEHKNQVQQQVTSNLEMLTEMRSPQGGLEGTLSGFAEKPEILNPQRTSEKIGYGAEKFAEFLLPSGKVNAGVKILDKSIDAKNLGFTGKALKLLGRGAAEATSAAGVTAAQGGTPKEIKDNAVVGGIFGVTAPAVLAGVKATGSVLLKRASKAYQEAMKPSLSARNVGKIPDIVHTGLSEGIILSEQGVQKTANMIDDFERKLGEAIDKAADIVRDADGNVISRNPNASTIKTANLEPFVNEVKKQISDISDVAYAEKAVQDIDNIYKNFVDKYGESLPVDKAQEIKTATYRWLKDAYGELASPVKEANKQLVRGLKEGIVDAAPTVQNINERLKMLYQFDEALQKASGRIGNLNLLGLGSKVVAAGVTGKYGVAAGAVVGILDKLVSSPGAKSYRAINYYRIGSMLNGLATPERLRIFENYPIAKEIFHRFTIEKP